MSLQWVGGQVRFIRFMSKIVWEVPCIQQQFIRNRHQLFDVFDVQQHWISFYSKDTVLICIRNLE